MKAYKGMAGAQIPINQPPLPPALSLLPLYILGLVKSPVFRSGKLGVHPDFRGTISCLFKSCSSGTDFNQFGFSHSIVDLASSIVYPHLYGVHTIADDVSEY
jgi:hypothetical protein